MGVSEVDVDSGGRGGRKADVDSRWSGKLCKRACGCGSGPIRDINRGCQRRQQPLRRQRRRLRFEAIGAVTSQVRCDALRVGVDIAAVQALENAATGVVQHVGVWAMAVGLPVGALGPRRPGSLRFTPAVQERQCRAGACCRSGGRMPKQRAAAAEKEWRRNSGVVVHAAAAVIDHRW